MFRFACNGELGLTMTDKKLLELAAKAYGLHTDSYMWDGIGFRELAVHGVPHCGFTGPFWNPITDDGDALRLAVRLGLTVETNVRGMSVAGNGDKIIAEIHDGDPCAITRRVIVRAAAEIGKASSNAGLTSRRAGD